MVMCPRSKNAPVSGRLIQNKTLQVSLKASNGWFEKFRFCYNITFKSMCGENCDVNLQIVKNWKTRNIMCLLRSQECLQFWRDRWLPNKIIYFLLFLMYTRNYVRTYITLHIKKKTFYSGQKFFGPLWHWTLSCKEHLPITNVLLDPEAGHN